MDNRSDFGSLLRQLRIGAGLTQEMLAERCNIAVRTISDLERGLSRSPRPYTLTLLVDALELSDEERSAFVAAARGSGKPGAKSMASQLVAGVPLQLTTFIGRASETELLAGLLSTPTVRLLTLTGPGGVGKTRLAIHLAELLGGEFPDGIAFIDLLQLDEADGLWQAIGRSSGEEENQPGTGDTTLELLRGRTMLLVLDNFEHIIDAAVHVSTMLRSCPNLKVLITSRAALQVTGEQVFEVQPLSTPSPGHDRTIEHLTEFDAVRLFVDRARLIRPEFALTERSADSVAAICSRLDGLPLAIELAAAQVRTMPPPVLLDRLKHSTDAPSLRLLKSGPRDAPARQQTLRSTIAWSHGLLTEDERELFRRLAVFVGGFTREAAAQVCGSAAAERRSNIGEDAIGIDDVLDALVYKCLVTLTEGPDGAQRFQMLETIAEFATEQLAISGELESIKGKHAEYFISMVESTGALLFAREQKRSLAFAEQGNVTAALQWLVQRG